MLSDLFGGKYGEKGKFEKFYRRQISNKCFIYSPAGDKLKTIVFWLYWQQDFEWSFIEAGLLIKQRCTKPIRGRACTLFLYGYCISIWYLGSFANCKVGLFQRNDLRWTTLYISPFNPQCLQAPLPFKGIIVSQSAPLLSFFKGQFKKLYVIVYATKQAKWSGGRGRAFGISAKNTIFPLLQQGQAVISVPVSWSIISSRVAVSFSSGTDMPISCLMVFKFSFRLRLAINP